MTESSINKWIDEILGCVGALSPVRSYRRLLRRSIDYPVHVWGCTLATDSSGGVAESSDRMPACGVALSSHRALASALGEACERYAFSACPPRCRELHISKPETIEQNYIRELPFFTSPYAESIDQIEIFLQRESKWLYLLQWLAEGRLSNEKIALPLSVLFADHSTQELPASTTGMAAGPTLEFALLRAICELVERDAFMCAWHHRCAGKRVDASCLLSKQIMEWIQRLKECNVEFRLHDISSDLFPLHVFLGYVNLLKDDVPMSFACGAGCSLDPYDVAERAFLEAALSWRGSDDLLTIRGILSDKDVDEFEPLSFSDHAYLYQHKSALHAVSHFLEQDEAVCKYPHVAPKQSITDQLRITVQILGEHNFKVYVLDVTPDEFDELPLKVVRAIIPGLVPLSWGPYRSILSKRLTAPCWIAPQARRAMPNLDHHPFP